MASTYAVPERFVKTNNVVGPVRLKSARRKSWDCPDPEERSGKRRRDTWCPFAANPVDHAVVLWEPHLHDVEPRIAQLGQGGFGMIPQPFNANELVDAPERR